MPSFQYMGFDSNPVTLPQKGIYHLTFEDDWLEYLKVEINEHGLNTDTFYTRKLSFTSHHNAVFRECDNPANGKVIDYYTTGKVRSSGTFRNGYVIDTLRKFFFSGAIQELFIPIEKKGKLRHYYYENGQLKTEYNSKSRVWNEYFDSGQLKRKSTWDRKSNTTLLYYNENGKLLSSKTYKEKKKYHSNSQIKDDFTRKEVNKLNRFFSKDKIRFYDYKWTNYTASGQKKYQISFSSTDFGSRDFPDSIQDISDYLFDKVVFFQNGVITDKLEVEHGIEEGKYMTRLFWYKKEGGDWRIQKKMSVNQVYQMFKQLK